MTTIEDHKLDTSTTRHSTRKIHGLQHVLAAAHYSFGGATRLLRETAFRHELLGAVLVVFIFAAVGATVRDYITMALLLLGLAAAEALNTAIEEIIDHISPEWSVTGLHAKNLGSFAVFCLLAANAILAAFIVVERLFLI